MMNQFKDVVRIDGLCYHAVAKVGLHFEGLISKRGLQWPLLTCLTVY